MTPNQTLAVAAIGGLAALLGLGLFTALGIGVYLTAQHVIHAHEERRERRRTLADYRRQLDNLPTTTHPRDH